LESFLFFINLSTFFINPVDNRFTLFDQNARQPECQALDKGKSDENNKGDEWMRNPLLYSINGAILGASISFSLSNTQATPEVC